MRKNIFEGFDFDPNNVEDEIYLSEAPLSLLLDNIKEQFADPSWDHSNDFVQSFINKYLYTKENELEEEEETTELLFDRFVGTMEKLLQEYLGIGIPGIDDCTGDEKTMEYIHYLYRFFILSIKKNFVRLLTWYIEKKRDKIYEQIPHKNDIAYRSYKSVVTNDIDCQIISSIGAAVELALDDIRANFTIDRFMKHVKADSVNLEISYILEAYDEGTVNGNFVPYYVDMVNELLLDEVTCTVKNKLLRKYTEE